MYQQFKYQHTKKFIKRKQKTKSHKNDIDVCTHFTLNLSILHSLVLFLLSDYFYFLV